MNRDAMNLVLSKNETSPPRSAPIESDERLTTVANRRKTLGQQPALSGLSTSIKYSVRNANSVSLTIQVMQSHSLAFKDHHHAALNPVTSPVLPSLLTPLPRRTPFLRSPDFKSGRALFSRANCTNALTTL